MIGRIIPVSGNIKCKTETELFLGREKLMEENLGKKGAYCLGTHVSCYICGHKATAKIYGTTRMKKLEYKYFENRTIVGWKPVQILPNWG